MRGDRTGSDSVTSLLSPVLLGQSPSWDVSTPPNTCSTESPGFLQEDTPGNRSILSMGGWSQFVSRGRS